jgi:hypothetical protein
MSVFLLTLNPNTETLHIFKCMCANEARGIQKRLVHAFSESLSNFIISDASENPAIMKSQYKSIKRYTYEQNRSYYVKRGD